MNEKDLRSIERQHIQAVLGCGAPQPNERDSVKHVHRIPVEQDRTGVPSTSNEPATIHYTELPEAKRASPLYHEWNLYRCEVGRLLGEGHEGRFLLIKEQAIIGIWDTQEEAKAAALEKYPMQPCLIHQVRSREPLVRVSSRIRQCLS